jgi:Ca-activated chloride channel family protein
MIDSLEWMRPAWLFALPVGIALLWVWWRAHAGLRPWRRLVDAELLEHLADRAPESSARLGLGIAIVVVVLVCVALAGPALRAPGTSPQRDLGARVVVLDLTPSMDAIDVAPSRLQRAREATADLLREAAGAQLAVVVFGADAFSVAPLTNDPATLIHLLAGATTTTIPRTGSRPDLGLEMARALLKRTGVGRGDVILVGDSAGDARTLEAARVLAGAGFPLSVLAVGTAHGGPVPVAGAFAKTETGDVLIARTQFAALEQIAQSGGGRFHVLGTTSEMPPFRTWAQERAETPIASPGAPGVSPDIGAWLALAALPFAALLFRRGWLAGLAAVALLMALQPHEAHAFDWRDLWQRSDQQAATAFRHRTPSETARALAKVDLDSPWYAMLLYRSGNFAEAAAQFSARDTAVAHYNRGNALALDGELDEAIAAYNAALARNPGMQDAQFNRALVRKALAARAQQLPDDGNAEGSNRQQNAPSATRRRGSTGSGTESLDARRNAPDAEERASARRGRAQEQRAWAQEEGEEASKAADRLSPGERERLEDVLSRVRNDPGSLLANRFAQQLQTRGAVHQDVGARW